VLPRDLLKHARKACSGDLLDLSNAEARRRARVVHSFCERADATPTARTPYFRVWGFGRCAGWAEDAKWPFHLREACSGFHEALGEVAQDDRGLDRLLIEMAQKVL